MHGHKGHAIYDEDLCGAAEVHGLHWRDENAENSESMEFELSVEKAKSQMTCILLMDVATGIVGPASRRTKRMAKDLQIGDKEEVRDIEALLRGICLTQEEKELGFSGVQVSM